MTGLQRDRARMGEMGEGKGEMERDKARKTQKGEMARERPTPSSVLSYCRFPWPTITSFRRNKKKSCHFMVDCPTNRMIARQNVL